MKKLNFSYTTFLLLLTTQLILCQDWSHRSSADYDDDEDDENENSESKYRSQESKNLNIGVALPWARTSRLHLPTIPPTFLVPIVQNSRKESDYKVPFFCRVEVKKGVKVVGQVGKNTKKYPKIFNQVSLLAALRKEGVHHSEPVSGHRPNRADRLAGQLLRAGGHSHQRPVAPLRGPPQPAPADPGAHPGQPPPGR